MTVYHGSNLMVDHPDTSHSMRNLDFGRGFYVTTIKEQAERWAKRKADLKGSKAVLNSYQMHEEWGAYTVLRFDDKMEDWIDFVCRCRDGEEIYKQYDLIIGKVADDKVFRVVDMYHAGIWDKQRALKEIRAYKTYDQIAFISQKAVDDLLTFQKAVEV